MPDRFLATDSACVIYGRGRAATAALTGVTLDFEPASLHLVSGPSGSGKTTLLSLLGCLRTPDAGAVFVEGRNVVALSESQRTEVRRRSIGFVFQACRLFHSLSALENVVLAAEVGGIRGRGRRLALAHHYLEQLGLNGKTRLLPDQLSGGEKQRVAIARAMVNNPPVVLADEPTAALDSQAGEQIAELLRDLSARQGRTVVVVSHDPIWQRYAHRVVTLRDGRVVEDRRGTAAGLPGRARTLAALAGTPGESLQEAHR